MKLRGPWAPLALVVVATIALPGRFLGDPTFLDGISLRVKARVLSIPELFDPAQTAVVNPYYRPLFTLLQRAADFLPGGPDFGERLLALACHAFAALSLWRYARALRLRRGVALGGLLIFLLAPPNLTTAAWPVVAYWTLAAGLTWLAAAELVEFAALGGRARVVRALLLVVVSLFCSETAYHLVALLPLLALMPPRAPGAIARRARPLLLWPLLAAIALVHLRICEPAASGLVTTAPLDRVKVALTAWPHYLEGVLGGDLLGGARPVAWAALALLVVGIGRSSRRRFLVLHALSAALPFAALGHNDRYGYFAYGVVALAFAACAPRGLTRVVHLLERRRNRVAAARRLELPIASGALIVLLAGIQSIQSAPRIAALRLAGRETAALVAGLAPIAPKLAELDRVAFVNCPSTLRWAVYDALPLKRPSDLVPLTTAFALCTARGYFAPTPLDLTPLRKTLVIECDDGRLVERAPDRPLGTREQLPWVFLARGLEVARRPARGFDGKLGDQRWFDQLLARTRTLEDPLEHVLVEQPVAGLSAPLPIEKIEWRLEPVPAAAGRAPPPGLFGQQLLVQVDVPRPAFLVAVTCLAAEDPLRRVTADFDRFSSLLEATLDDRPAPIVPAFVHGCGIVVPAGSHQVLLRARPLGGNGFADAAKR